MYVSLSDTHRVLRDVGITLSNMSFCLLTIAHCCKFWSFSFILYLPSAMTLFFFTFSLLSPCLCFPSSFISLAFFLHCSLFFLFHRK